MLNTSCTQVYIEILKNNKCNENMILLYDITHLSTIYLQYLYYLKRRRVFRIPPGRVPSSVSSNIVLLHFHPLPPTKWQIGLQSNLPPGSGNPNARYFLMSWTAAAQRPHPVQRSPTTSHAVSILFCTCQASSAATTYASTAQNPSNPL
jgi:hypothetical protein